MMLSYAKHPELRLLDDEQCRKVLDTDYRRKPKGPYSAPRALPATGTYQESATAVR